MNSPKDLLKIIPVVEGNTLHYQTEPYVGDDGKIYVKRLSSHPITILNVGEVIQESKHTVSYKEED